MSNRFTDRIATRLLNGRAPAVIGLDPRLEALPERVAPNRTPAERIVAFYGEAMPLLAAAAVAVKPNIAFFEAFGSLGYAAYEETCRLARRADLPIIGDVKRGDIGSTAAAYAAGHFALADALTLHPYLGSDSIEPFLQRGRASGGAVFVLVRTSNPSATEFQDLSVGAHSLSECVADAVTHWGEGNVDEFGYSDVGAVIGATYADQIEALRRRMPRAWLLIPGVGAQGGEIAALRPAFDERGLGALVNQSRGIMQCFDPSAPDWLAQIEASLDQFCRQLREVVAAP